MSSHFDPLKPEDYIEPRCLLCDLPAQAEVPIASIPQQRVIQKLDEYMAHKDYSGAERHLAYWLEEAKEGHDLRGQLLVLNEMIGFYRKTGRKEDSFKRIEEALSLLPVLGFESHISAGTTYTNAATAYYTFGAYSSALPLFEKAQAVYEQNPHTSPSLLGGLYNNMGLTYAALRDFSKAYSLYDRAMNQMENVPGGDLEQAITCLNRANAIEAEIGLESGENRIFDCLDQAQKLLENSKAPQNGYFAFVCETCAPTFSYYGYFMTANQLQKKAEEIYERS